MRCRSWPIVVLCSAAATGIFALCTIANKAGAQETAKSANGADIYKQARCFACHGEFGFGGAGPRFREDRFLGLTDYVVGQILMGRDIMPAFGEVLDNQQIAAVATYIRTSWGNRFGQVQPQQVAAVRKDVKLHPVQGRPAMPPSPPSSGSAAAAEPPPPNAANSAK